MNKLTEKEMNEFIEQLSIRLREAWQDGEDFTVDNELINFRYISPKDSQWDGERWTITIHKPEKRILKNTDLCSMNYWYPKIKDLNYPQPKTIKIDASDISQEEWYAGLDGRPNEKVVLMPTKIKKAIKDNDFNYPIFMRTDQFSGKHGWKRTCFVEREEDLAQNLGNLVEDNFMAGMFDELPIKSFYVREYISMDNLFEAFYGDMPVNPEIRLFVRDGELEEYYWYWAKEAIEQGRKQSIENWEEILQAKKEEITDELDEGFLKKIAMDIGTVISGYWSVDICRAKNGDWYLIDMALAELSWYPNR